MRVRSNPGAPTRATRLPRPRDPDKLFASLPCAERRRIVEEIVLTRADELRRAYPGTRTVLVGNKAQTREVLEKTCVVFVVDEKTERDKLRPDDMIPSHLKAVSKIGRTRRLVHVPTDVEAIATLSGAVPTSAIPCEITVSSAGLPSSGGQVCCLLRRKHTSRLLAISCRHVLTLDPARYRGGGPAALMRLGDDNLEIGEASPWGGAIVTGSPTGPWSFDAQLINLEDSDESRALLRAALGSTSCADWAKAHTDLPERDAYVQTTREPIRVQIALMADPHILINYDNGNIEGHHEQLIVYTSAESPLAGGDSGAPLTSEPEGGLLLGMHIAVKSNERRGYAVPAWHLMDPTRYENGTGVKRPPSERWQLEPPTSLPEPPPLRLGNNVVGQPVPGTLQPPPNPPGNESAFVSFAIAATRELQARGFPINPVATAAQAILETGYGTSDGARLDNAYFGIRVF